MFGFCIARSTVSLHSLVFLWFLVCSVAASASTPASVAVAGALVPPFTSVAFTHKVGGVLNILNFFNVMNLFFFMYCNLYFLKFILFSIYIMLVVSLEYNYRVCIEFEGVRPSTIDTCWY